MIFSHEPAAYSWHRWFAWYPVRLHNTATYVWLETVERLFRANDWPRIPIYRRPSSGDSGE
jgi:hypothetical protein